MASEYHGWQARRCLSCQVWIVGGPEQYGRAAHGGPVDYYESKLESSFGYLIIDLQLHLVRTYQFQLLLPIC